MGKQKEGEKKGDGGKKEEGAITVVFKVDMHCEGCAKRVKRSVKHFDGVEDVKGDSSNNKLTVVGKVDPEKLRERIEAKTKKKVVLVSPLPKKDGKDGGGKDEKKADDKGKADDKKPKEPPVTTVVLKIRLHCQGCIHKIRRIILKTKGVQDVKMDAAKDLVTVTGTMDVKALQAKLKEKLRGDVEIVPPKKDDDKKGKDGSGEKKDKEGGGGGGGGDKKDNKDKDGEKKGGGGEGGGKKEESSAAAGKPEVNKMEHHWGGYSGPGYSIEYVHAPQIFSDENPNACSIM